MALRRHRQCPLRCTRKPREKVCGVNKKVQTRKKNRRRRQGGVLRFFFGSRPGRGSRSSSSRIGARKNRKRQRRKWGKGYRSDMGSETKKGKRRQGQKKGQERERGGARGLILTTRYMRGSTPSGQRQPAHLKRPNNLHSTTHFKPPP